MLDRFAASSPVRAVSVSIALNVFKGYVIKVQKQNSFAVFLVLCATPRLYCTVYSTALLPTLTRALRTSRMNSPRLSFQMPQGTYNYEYKLLVRMKAIVYWNLLSFF